MSLRKQTPSDFLKQIIGRPVVVKLNSGVDYRDRVRPSSLVIAGGFPVTSGVKSPQILRNTLAQQHLFLQKYSRLASHYLDRVLACLDGYMNIALEQTEEYVNGQLKNKYGDAFIRGNNVLYISTQKRRM